MPGDFPEGGEFEPRHLLQRREGGISPSTISQNVELVAATGGAVYDVFAQDNYAYVCAYGLLIILDVSTPSNPIRVGDILLPSGASGVYVQDSLAYVADGYSGLRIIDVSVPSSPTEVGFYDTPNYATDVYVQDSLAYVVDYDDYYLYWSVLRIIDVSVPSSPIEVGYHYTAYFAFSVYVQDSLAYVACYDDGLRIIDVSVPSSPVEVGFCDVPGLAFDVYVQDSLAYVADGRSLRIIDVSIPSSPIEVGFYDTLDYACDIYVQDSLAYVVDESGLHIIDVSVPSSPTEVGFCETPDDAIDVYVHDSLAYVANGHSLRIIDVGVPSSPTEVGFYNTPAIAHDVYVQDSLAYVVDGLSGLRIIDVSVPSSPAEIGCYDTPDWAWGVYVQDSLAYVADRQSGLRIIDVSVPSSPTEVGFYDTPYTALGVYVQDSFAYVADNDSGLRIIDVSIPSSPTEVGFYDTPSHAWDVYVQDSLAYVADDDSGLRIIDVSVPSSPTEVGFYDTSGYAKGVYVQDSFAYMAYGSSGLRIIDVSVPSSPIEVGFCDAGNSYGVYVQDGLAYMAGESSGLHIIDVSVPSSPVEVGFYDAPGDAYGVYVQDSLAYVASKYGGLYIFRYTGEMPDIIPPSAITDLATSNPMPDSITLTWTASGDDGDVGTASQYDIRYSTSPIDEGNWDAATQVDGEPAPSPSGTAETFTVTGLFTATTYYFAMKVADEVPNWSELSNIASAKITRAYHAVVVGVADYPGAGSDLDYPDDDAIDIMNALLLYKNWEDDNIQLLLDSEATKSNIQTAIENMGNMASEGDVCLFFFSGHGTNTEDIEPIDESDGLDEYICSYGASLDEFICDDELSDWLGSLPTTNVVVILDACYSGGQIKVVDGFDDFDTTSLVSIRRFAPTQPKPQSKPQATQPKGFTPKVLPGTQGVVKKGDGFAADITSLIRVEDMDDNPGCVVLTACEDDELSWEFRLLRNGLFSYSVISGLAKNVDKNGNEELSAEEIGKYARFIVNLLNKFPFLKQHPQLYDDYPHDNPKSDELTLCIGTPRPVSVIHNESIEYIISLAAPAIADVPKSSKLLQNYSNPFNPDTWIPYQLSEGGYVTIRIYNLTGQLMRMLDLGHKQAGFHLSRGKAAYWDGKNEAGEQVASSLYFYVIQAGNFTATKKMLLLK